MFGILIVPQEQTVPLVVKNLPDWALCEGRRALIAAVVVVAPVPPLATGNVPVTPVDSGKPVQFVNVPDVGVPRIGVISVGLVAKTSAPDPVSSVTAVARFAEPQFQA